MTSHISNIDTILKLKPNNYRPRPGRIVVIVEHHLLDCSDLFLLNKIKKNKTTTKKKKLNSRIDNKNKLQFFFIIKNEKFLTLSRKSYSQEVYILFLL